MINVVFLGTPEIAIETLNSLFFNEKINVLAVITPLDKPQGRKMILTPPPIKIFALDKNIPVFQTKSIRKDENLINSLKKLNPDFFITFAYGQILSQEVLDIPKIGTVNIHASLLPKYRGANPIQHAIINGDKVTGITTMLTSLGMDEGDICLKKEIEISQNLTDIELKEKISKLSPSLLLETLFGLYEKTLKPIKQISNEATYANKFEKTDGLIDFKTLTSEEIHNKVRGLLSWPTCYFEFKGKKIKILSTEIKETSSNTHIGEITEIDKKGLTIQTKKGCIKIIEVQPESKNKMTAFAWNNAIKLKIGDKIC